MSCSISCRRHVSCALSQAVVAICIAVLVSWRVVVAQQPGEPSQQATEPAKTATAPARDSEIQSAPRVVFLNLDRSAVGSLVEAKLRAKNVVNWWPRHASYRLLRDIELSTAIDVPRPADDRETPPPLADAMILLRTHTSGKSSLAELVVCDPRLGLRLGSRRMPLSDNMAQDVETLADAAIAPLGKLKEPASRLYGVPPFRCVNLGGDEDDLRQLLGQETEQTLLKQRGRFLVELDYAYAIGAVRKLAGIDEPIRRLRPWFLLGEYRVDPSDSGRKLAISLTLHRGDSPPQIRKLDPLPMEEALATLRKRVGEGANFADFSPALDNPAGEIKLLDVVQRECQKAGDMETQIALAETSLLLIPGDQQLRNEAASLLGRLAWQEWRKAEELPLPVAPPAGPTESVVIEGTKPAEQTERQYEQALVRAINYARRSLAHVNIVAESLKPPPPPDQVPKHAPRLPVVQYGHAIPTPRSTSSDALKALARPLQQARARLALTMAPIHAHNGEPGDVYMIRELPPADRQAVALRLILEFKDYPEPERRIQQYVLSGLAAMTGGSPEDDDRFLKQVEAIDHPAIAAAVRNAREQLARQAEARKPRIVTLPAARRPQAPQPSEARPPEAPTDVDAQIVFKQFALPLAYVAQQSRCDLCLAAGPDIDLFGASGQILLMRKKGEAKVIWRGNPGLSFRNFATPPSACYDGKYAWIPVSFPLKLSQLVVVDPQTGKVTEVTKDHGIPEGPVPVGFQPMLSAAPLSPGKALLVGTFGQTWLAIASFDPEKGPSVKVIHECVEQAVDDHGEQWRSSKLAFGPHYVVTLSGKLENSEKVEQRVLVGRQAGGGAALHPLIVNPETNRVDVLEADYMAFAAGQPIVAEGAMYVSVPSQKGRAIWRTGFPDFQPKMIADVPVKGTSFNATIGMESGRVHLIHDQWHTGPSWDKPLKPLRGKLPWNRDEFIWLLRSNHYGWIAQTLNSQAYVVELHDVPEDRPGEPKDANRKEGQPQPDTPR